MFLKGENVLGGKTLEAYACQVVFVLKKEKGLQKGFIYKKESVF